MSEAAQHLTENQVQLNAFGTMVGVSRQALDEVLAENAALQAKISECIEIYAGMEGFLPKTAPEAYLLRIIDQMNKALQGTTGDK